MLKDTIRNNGNKVCDQKEFFSDNKFLRVIFVKYYPCESVRGVSK